jgi:hypothetical protein
MRVQIIKLLSENMQLRKYTSQYEALSTLPGTVIGWVCSRYPAAFYDHRVGEGTEVCGKTA